jgi:hypothetical protein
MFDWFKRRASGEESTGGFVPLAEELFSAPLSEEADQFLKSCDAEYDSRQRAFRARWLGDQPRFSLDLERGILRLSNAQSPPRVFEVEVVGSYCARSLTWEWTWANPNMPQSTAVPRAALAAVGEKYDLKYLLSAFVPVSDQQLPHNLSGIALKVREAMGVYVATYQELSIFVLIKRVAEHDGESEAASPIEASADRVASGASNADDDSHRAARVVHQEPLVWHPAIRALAWVGDWVFFAICVATVWVFIETRSLSLGPVLIRGAWILAGIALLPVVLIAVEMTGSLFMHAYHDYERRFAIGVGVLAAIVCAAVLAPYLWLMKWVLDWVWRVISDWAMRQDFSSAHLFTGDPWPTWLLAPLLTAVCVIVASLIPRTARQTVEYYGSAFRLYGVRRALRGVLLMTLLRLRLPRKDLFGQAPVISWMPMLALATLLHVVIPLAVFSWIIPAALLFLFLAMNLAMIAPPTWLFLGTSEFDSFAAFHVMRRVWRQHGLTLLDRVGSEGAQFYAAQRRAGRWGTLFFNPAAPRVWSLRTRPQMWESSVMLLMDFVLVVIADVRGESEIVREELGWLTRPGRLEKAWYLVTDEGRGAALDNDSQSSEPLHLATNATRNSRRVTLGALRSQEWFRANVQISR